MDLKFAVIFILAIIVYSTFGTKIGVVHSDDDDVDQMLEKLEDILSKRLQDDDRDFFPNFGKSDVNRNRGFWSNSGVKTKAYRKPKKTRKPSKTPHRRKSN